MRKPKVLVFLQGIERDQWYEMGENVFQKATLWVNTCSKLTLKTLVQRLNTCSSVFIIYFEQVFA